MNKKERRKEKEAQAVTDSIFTPQTKKVIYRVLEDYSFSPNTEETWAKVRRDLDFVFKKLEERGILYEHGIVCDDKVNLPVTIDKGELHVGILYKKEKSSPWLFQHLILKQQKISKAELERYSNKIKEN